MALARPLKNTDKDYACTSCGSDHVSVIREDDVNPRLKCNACNFMFNGKDSLEAIEAGAIKPSSAESLADASDPEVEHLHIAAGPEGPSIPVHSHNIGTTLTPKNPAYLFISKDRKNHQLSSKRDFKKSAIIWSQSKPFNVYELKPVTLSVKVDLG